MRDIKNLLFTKFTEGYEPDPELDEDETIEDREQAEFEDLQDNCNKIGLIPPEK